MKTPQEVFTLMLKHWNTLDHGFYSGICLKISELYFHNLISREEKGKAKTFLIKFQREAIAKFGAYKNYQDSDYWWPVTELKIRKQFVKFLSEQS